MKTADERIAEAVGIFDEWGGCAGAAEPILRRMILALQPPPARHTFGGVVFEETGEVREPRDSDWFLYTEDEACCCTDAEENYPLGHPILRPVSVEVPRE